MEILKQTALLIRKEITVEFREKSSFYSLLLYVSGIVFVSYVSFYLKTNQLSTVTWNAIFWISMLFVAINAIAKSFMADPSGRKYYYYFVVDPKSIILSRIIYNFLLMIVLSFMTFGMMNLLLPIVIENQGLFLFNLFVGAFAFSSELTLVSAIASTAKNNGALMAILSIPVMIPMILLLVKISNDAIDGLLLENLYEEFLLVGLINVLLIGVSYILFPYLWKS